MLTRFAEGPRVGAGVEQLRHSCSSCIGLQLQEAAGRTHVAAGGSCGMEGIRGLLRDALNSWVV